MLTETCLLSPSHEQKSTRDKRSFKCCEDCLHGVLQVGRVINEKQVFVGGPLKPHDDPHDGYPRLVCWAHHWSSLEHSKRDSRVTRGDKSCDWSATFFWFGSTIENEPSWTNSCCKRRHETCIERGRSRNHPLEVEIFLYAYLFCHGITFGRSEAVCWLHLAIFIISTWITYCTLVGVFVVSLFFLHPREKSDILW